MGRPIWVSDSLMDFFLRKTLSPFRDTTLNSIFPEKVAVSDLQEILYGKKSWARVHITFINSVVDPDLEGSGTLGQVEIGKFRLVRI